VAQDDDELDQWAGATAIIGLRGAYKRYRDACNHMIPLQELAGASIVEFVTWACLLDRRLEDTDNSYVAHRDTDDDGEVLLALRFVRDRHLHQVVTSAALQFMVRWSTVRPPAIESVGMTWRALADIKEPTDRYNSEHEYRLRRAAYQEDLEGRDPLIALEAALRFLTREVQGKGIEVPNEP
jgi:hypothetical protein